MNNCTIPPSSTHCPCDEFIHPQPLEIAAGLKELPRQVAGFPEFRRAMLRAITEYGALAGWQARKEEDLGVMLIEMWAYVCDVLAFYDGVIAHESYLRTARLRPSVRKLVDLLGYLPRPATASTVDLAVLANGRQPVKLPKGLAFKSGAFGAEPPQTFELEADTVVHPFANQWEIARIAYTTLGIHQPYGIFVVPLRSFEAGQVVSVVNAAAPGQNTGHRITDATRIQDPDGSSYIRLTLVPATGLKADSTLHTLSVHSFSGKARLWAWDAPSLSYTTADAIDETTLFLDRIYTDLTAGSEVVIEVAGAYHRCIVSGVGQQARVSTTTTEVSINNSKFQVPTSSILVTRITISGNPGLQAAFQQLPHPGWVTVHFGAILSGKIVRESIPDLKAGDPLQLVKPAEQPMTGYAPKRFLLQDKNTIGQLLQGALVSNGSALAVPDTSGWKVKLQAPVKAHGNVVTASRGETVKNEILGSGNAGQANQAFQLKKKPLTYHLSPTYGNDQGVASTLEVHVDGLRWKEVRSFYLAGPEDEVYIVRQTDTGDSIVTFGDGQRGRRLPSGRNNVVAHYRFGAGAATPPAGSITQITSSVAGLQSVVNPVMATPGGDAEDQENIRQYGPQSVLIMGRAVSMKDMEAVAETIPGVRRAQAEWRWSGKAQQATAHLWYIGGDGLKPNIETMLRNVSDPSTPITVEAAVARPMAMFIGIWHDPRRDTKQVEAAVREALLGEKTGFLLPENLGIGQHLFRSQLFAALMAVPGCKSVAGIITLQPGKPFQWFHPHGLRQAPGKYWEIKPQHLFVALAPDMI